MRFFVYNSGRNGIPSHPIRAMLTKVRLYAVSYIKKQRDTCVIEWGGYGFARGVLLFYFIRLMKRGIDMTKNEFLNFCKDTFGTVPDCPFENDFVSTVLRHGDTRKWYAIVLEVSRRKFGFDSDEIIDVVNVKLPIEMLGSFGKNEGVYPAYHMNKLHWASVLLPDAPNDVVTFLTSVSYEATRAKRKNQK